MRLYPSIPLLPRQTIDKCIIDGYEIQPKTLVYINSWAIGRDPELDLVEEHPGINLGVTTVELALANLLYSFDWKLPARMKIEDIDIDINPSFTVH
ncbi:cytochrome P450 71B9-like [Camellia sinensis]|uniref:cytochrome P450 71B9-like n=1 Tax=Camellia sinensis TaxID=4442 RepID=UPI0010366237|nr:cytochrome P450 71B9-like [Camellia sinensis]